MGTCQLLATIQLPLNVRTGSGSDRVGSQSGISQESMGSEQLLATPGSYDSMSERPAWLRVRKKAARFEPGREFEGAVRK